MDLKELQQFDLENVIYNRDEFSTVAIKADEAEILLNRDDGEEYGDIEQDMYRVQSSDAELLSAGDILLIDGVEREILTLEPIEQSLGLEHWLTFESRNI